MRHLKVATFFTNLSNIFNDRRKMLRAGKQLLLPLAKTQHIPNLSSQTRRKEEFLAVFTALIKEL